MTRSSSARTYRRQVKKGMLSEIKRRIGRDVSTDGAIRQLMTERIREKERASAVQDVAVSDK